MRRPVRTRPALAAALLGALALGACGGPSLAQVQPHIHVKEKGLVFPVIPVLNHETLAADVDDTGQAPLTLSAKITGPDADAFALGTVESPVPAGGTTKVNVTFTPPDERTYQATLELASNDPDTPVVKVSLAGEGKTKGCLSVTPDHLDFGTVGEGQTAVLPFTLTAGCTAPLLVDSVAFAKGTSQSYQPVGSWGSGTLNPGDSLPLSVAFRPRPGEQVTTGTIEVHSADPLKPIQTVALAAQINRAPIPDCGQSEVDAAPGDTVTFDGSASHDPDGNTPLTYAWRVDARPLDSNTDLVGADTARPTLDLDVPGDWTVSLSVTDSTGVASVSRCQVAVKAIPAEKLYVELVWDNAVTDLDLHFLAPNASYEGAKDCWWANQHPDFGVQGDPSDDPSCGPDDLAGFGPETATYDTPADGTYTVVVDFPKDNGAAHPDTHATVRVYELGVVVAELDQDLKKAHERWIAGTIDWPSGKVTPSTKVTTY